MSELALIFLWALLASLPLGLPTMIVIEKKQSGPVWVFLGVALLHGLAITLWAYFVHSQIAWELSALFTVPFLAGWLTYWTIAWRLYPPAEIAEERLT